MSAGLQAGADSTPSIVLVHFQSFGEFRHRIQFCIQQTDGVARKVDVRATGILCGNDAYENDKLRRRRRRRDAKSYAQVLEGGQMLLVKRSGGWKGNDRCEKQLEIEVLVNLTRFQPNQLFIRAGTSPQFDTINAWGQVFPFECANTSIDGLQGTVIDPYFDGLVGVQVIAGRVRVGHRHRLPIPETCLAMRKRRQERAGRDALHTGRWVESSAKVVR